MSRWTGAFVGLMLGLLTVTVFAQSWTAPRTWVQGELVTPSLMNTHVRDNLTVLRAGGIAISGQGSNEIIYASSASQLTRSSEFVWTGDALVIAGRVNSATEQPGFLAYNSATDSANTQHTVDFDTEEYDNTTAFASDTFTVAVAGDYLLCTTVQVQNNVASANQTTVLFAIAGTGARQYDVATVTLAASVYGSGGGCVVADLVAANTVTVMVASASNTTVVGSSTRPTTFSARLMS